MRSAQPCPMCDRPKPITRELVDTEPAPPPEQLIGFAFSLAAPGVPTWPQVRPDPVPAADIADGLDPDTVLDMVATAHFVSVGDLLSKDRHQSIAQARHVACWALRRLCCLSYPQIGRRVGNRDHTTAMSSVRRVEIRRLRDARYRQHTDRVLAMLGGDAG